MLDPPPPAVAADVDSVGVPPHVLGALGQPLEGLYHTILHHTETILYHINYTILYYTILYYTILGYTMIYYHSI